MNMTNKKCLIAYFSRKGLNYSSGGIVDLKVGNTEVVAQMIRKKTGGDLFHIESVTAYPKDYTETTEVAMQALSTDARPQLKEYVEAMDSYSIILLGYPNWWGTMPMPVFTFLEAHDLSGKTIVPFCTHEGSGFGRSVAEIRKICPRSTVLDGLAIRGGDVHRAQDEVSAWLHEIGMKA